MPSGEPMLRSGEVARLFHVDLTTVGRWALEGRLPSVRTPGGQYRYPAAQIYEILNDRVLPRKTVAGDEESVLR